MFHSAAFNFAKVITDFHKSNKDSAGLLHCVPVILSLALVGAHLFFLCRALSNEVLSILVTALSIFCALFFGLLIPSIDQARRLREAEARVLGSSGASETLPLQDQHDLRRIRAHITVSRNLFTNVVFCVISSLGAVPFLILAVVIGPRTWQTPWADGNWLTILGVLLQIIGLYLTGVFGMATMSLIRRMYVSFLEEVK